MKIMKSKQILIFALTSLIALSQLCSCQAPAKNSGHESQWETQTPETEKNYASLEELVNSFLPEINTGESAQWEGKISDDIYTGTAHDNGKYLVCLRLIEPPRSIVPQLCEARYQFDGVRMTEPQGWMIYQTAFLDRFIDLYVKNPQDVLVKYYATFILYASKSEMEAYAKCPRVTHISSGDAFLDDNKIQETDVIG